MGERERNAFSWSFLCAPASPCPFCVARTRNSWMNHLVDLGVSRGMCDRSTPASKSSASVLDQLVLQERKGNAASQPIGESRTPIAVCAAQGVSEECVPVCSKPSSVHRLVACQGTQAGFLCHQPLPRRKASKALEKINGRGRREAEIVGFAGTAYERVEQPGRPLLLFQRHAVIAAETRDAAVVAAVVLRVLCAACCCESSRRTRSRGCCPAWAASA